MKLFHSTDEEWHNFVKNWVSYDDKSNVKSEFSKLSKSGGIAYMEYLQTAWVVCKDSMTEADFCNINGNVPRKFFETKIKDAQIEVIEIHLNKEPT